MKNDLLFSKFLTVLSQEPNFVRLNVRLSVSLPIRVVIFFHVDMCIHFIIHYQVWNICQMCSAYLRNQMFGYVISISMVLISAMAKNTIIQSFSTTAFVQNRVS
jgi:hypothetical protein